MKSYWFPIAVLGALIYGTFSLLLGVVSPEIKKDSNAQLGFGLMIAIIAIPVNLTMFFIWKYKYPKSYETLFKYINWPVFFLLVIIAITTNPVHTLVFNAGGSLGQQTMYSLAIVPVILGSWLILKEHLNTKQWLGIVIAGLGTFFMTSKKPSLKK